MRQNVHRRVNGDASIGIRFLINVVPVVIRGCVLGKQVGGGCCGNFGINLGEKNCGLSFMWRIFVQALWDLANSGSQRNIQQNMTSHSVEYNM